MREADIYIKDDPAPISINVTDENKEEIEAFFTHRKSILYFMGSTNNVYMVPASNISYIEITDVEEAKPRKAK